jgi:hypothetical protein
MVKFPWLLLLQLSFWSGLVALCWRRRRQLALGVAWKVIFYLPVLRLYANQRYTHYQYLPNIATALLTALAAWEIADWAAGRLRRKTRPLVWATVVSLGVLLLVGVYARGVQRGLPMPSLQTVMRGGVAPPATLGREPARSPFSAKPYGLSSSEAPPPRSVLPFGPGRQGETPRPIVLPPYEGKPDPRENRL